MYVETMTTEEKLKEFQKAYEKIYTVANRIVDRLNINKYKEGNEIYLGIRKLTIDNTEYYYSLTAFKVRNKNNLIVRTKYRMQYVFEPYTIQTHGDSRNKYIIMFNAIPPRELGYTNQAFIRRVNSIIEVEYHLIVRYRDRFLKNSSLSIEESLERYMKNNYDGYLYYKDCRVGKDVVRVTRDGISLGVICDGYTAKLKTFITEEQLRKDQLLWSKYGDLWKEYLEKFNKQMNNPFVYY